MKQKIRILALAFGLAVLAALIATPAFADDYPIVVTLGDSYASGDGLEPYVGQGGAYKYWNEDWVGHRSSGSWESQLVVGGYTLGSVRATPALEVVENGGTRTFSYDAWSSDGLWYDIATSAAYVIHICGDELDSQSYLEKSVYKIGTDFGTVSYTARYAPQVKVFDYLNQTFGAGSVDFVTLMVGGNDVGFGDVMVKAATSSNKVSELLDKARTTFATSTRAALERSLWAIRAAAGANAHVILVGYPLLFDGAKANVLFSATEYAQIDAFDLWLDGQYADIVTELNAAGFDTLHYVSLVDAFKGHGAYSSDNYISGVVFMDEEAFDDSDELRYISAASIHPNAKGASVIAAEVQKVIDEIEAGGDEPHAPGWAYENGSWYYYKDDGTLLTNEWVQGGGKWYYFGADGKLVYSEWVYYGGKWYFLNSSGNPVFNNWVSYGGKWYFVNKNGNPVVNDWVSYGGKWYFVNKNGNPVVNDFVQYAGYWFFFDKNGNPVTNQWVDYAGYSFYFNESGICVDWKEAA